MPVLSDVPGQVRPARRPAGWTAPGPAPAGPVDASVLPCVGEDLCFLTGDWRILQRQEGHRWSLDDLITAWTAITAVEVAPDRVLDLGCGIGSVLMMVAWAFPQARAVGIEAQALSVDLARRSLRYNGAAERVAVLQGDLRALARNMPRPEPERDGSLALSASAPHGVALAPASFALVTGTPPYFTPGSATPSERPQCRPCRLETRGGVEDYLDAAVHMASDRGTIVLCGAAGQRGRLERALRGTGWGAVRWVTVVPRSGKAPLLFTVVLRRGAGRAAEHSLTVRDTSGQWTEAFREVRRRMGMPPAPPGPP